LQEKISYELDCFYLHCKYRDLLPFHSTHGRSLRAQNYLLCVYFGSSTCVQLSSLFLKRLRCLCFSFLPGTLCNWTNVVWILAYHGVSSFKMVSRRWGCDYDNGRELPIDLDRVLCMDKLQFLLFCLLCYRLIGFLWNR